MKFIPLKTKIKYLNKIYLFQGCLYLVAAVNTGMDNRYEIVCWNSLEDVWSLLGYSRANYFEWLEKKGIIFYDNTQENLTKLKLRT